jgi:hypothetical protein
MGTLGTVPYRPTEWQSDNPAQVIITFPGLGSSPQYNSASGVNSSLPTEQTNYVFDAVIVAGHEQILRKTEHPVQTGASLSDHAFLEPPRLMLDVLMTDVVDSYYNPSTWTGDQSKSVSAYQTMLALQQSRIPVTVTTRLRVYENMLITDLSPTETVKTIQGLRMRVVFSQVFMATTATFETSARPQDTGETQQGSVTPVPPTDAQISQNSIPGVENVPAVPSNAVGEGEWGSNSVNNLLSLVPKL